jgi:hypothetical protein
MYINQGGFTMITTSEQEEKDTPLVNPNDLKPTPATTPYEEKADTY